MINILDQAMHICERCEKELAAGVDANGLPNLCSKCLLRAETPKKSYWLLKTEIVIFAMWITVWICSKI